MKKRSDWWTVQSPLLIVTDSVYGSKRETDDCFLYLIQCGVLVVYSQKLQEKQLFKISLVCQTKFCERNGGIYEMLGPKQDKATLRIRNVE